jgi:hypothetical protein
MNMTFFHNIRKSLIPFYLWVYRTTALVAIVGALTYLAGWSFVLIFFLFSNTWMAPTVLSPTSDKMLQFEAGYQAAVQNYQTVKVAESQAERDLEFANNNARELHILGKQMESYMKRTVVLNGHQKQNDLTGSYALLKDLEVVKQQTEQSRKAGLITNEDAIQTIATIQSFRDSTTDGDIAFGTTDITMNSARVTLIGQIAQADNDVHTKQETLEASKISFKLSKDVVHTLENSAYLRAMNGGSNLAFIPYDSLFAAKIGAPVYDCYAMIILCHKVGTVTKVFKDEQLVDFPLFNIKLSRTVRGVFVEMEITHPESMKSTIVFVGSKPLFF